MPDSLKREFRIDSSDAARPAAQLGDEPYHYAQGLKPKPRIITDVNYEKIEGETVTRGKEKPVAALILKTTTYDDGVTIDTTVGEDNADYQDYLRGAKRIADGGSTSTRMRRPTNKPAAPKKTSKSDKE